MFHFDERMPDCVPEYYRSRQEDEDHRYEQRMQRQAHYLANREKLAAAAASGLPVLTLCDYGPCWDCQTADHDTMIDEDDDIDCVICLNPSCPQHEIRQSGEESR